MTDNVQLKALQDYNEGFKPQGDWVNKPAVPATTVTVENLTGYDFLVEVTAGTVTAVKVDGVTIGARVSGAFLVRNKSTIAWVGSVAPTWQWFYL
jgi:hypothetical protein